MNLTPHHLDALREMINIGVGRAAGVLNAMLHSHVILRLPHIELLAENELEAKVRQFGLEAFAAVRLGFRGPFAGNASLVFPTDSAAKLVVLLTEGELELATDPDLDSIRIGTLTEVGNIVLNSVMGAIGNELQQRIFYSVPTFQEESLPHLLVVNVSDQPSSVIWVQTQFAVEHHRIDGDIILVFEMGSLDLLMTAIDHEVQMKG